MLMYKLTTARCKTYVEAFGFKNSKRTRKVKDDLGVTLRVFTVGDRCFVIESGYDDQHVLDIHPLDVPDVSADDLKDSRRPWLQKRHVGPAMSTDIQMTPAEFWTVAKETAREEAETRREIHFEDVDGVDPLLSALVEHLADGATVTWLREALTTAPKDEGLQDYLGSLLCWIDGYADEDEWEAAQAKLGTLLDGWEW
jgi:hypothetical protein